MSMANICLYKVKVIGKKATCYALVNMMPLCSWEKEFIDEYGTDAQYTLIFSGACKWGIGYRTEPQKDLTPFTDEQIENIQDGDFWHFTLQDKSLALNCEIMCNSKDIDSSCWADYEHYKNGKEIFDECPKELHIKRGRDYDVDYATINIKQEPISSAICKVKFKGGTYWYAGDYEIGDLVYVEGAKANELGVVIEKKTTSATGYYKILNSIHNIDLFKSDDVEALWNRYKKKDRILYYGKEYPFRLL